MQPCRTCRKPVARDATTCPHCGEQYPAGISNALGITILVILALPFLLMVGCTVIAIAS